MSIASTTASLTSLKPQADTEAPRGEGELNTITEQLQSWQRSPEVMQWQPASTYTRWACQIVGGPVSIVKWAGAEICRG